MAHSSIVHLTRDMCDLSMDRAKVHKLIMRFEYVKYQRVMQCYGFCLLTLVLFSFFPIP